MVDIKGETCFIKVCDYVFTVCCVTEYSALIYKRNYESEAAEVNVLSGCVIQ